jgi:ATP-dependent DNA helicase PIF1
MVMPRLKYQKELLITGYDDPIKAIVESTYPNLLQHYNCPQYLQSKAILASTIEIVDQINNYDLNLIPGKHLYISNKLVQHNNQKH